MIKVLTALIMIMLSGAAAGPDRQAAIIGELKQWHRVTLTFDGPNSSEGATSNPFRDYRPEVTLSNGGRRIAVPGYYAADGKAGESGAVTSVKGPGWRSIGAPPEVPERDWVVLIRLTKEETTCDR